AVLLVADLKRPERFLRVVFRPNLRSWLARGAYILIAFGGVAFLWGVQTYVASPATLLPLAIVCVALAAAASGYTAFLFGQAEGRDFWQSPLLLPHLLVQATVAGASVLAILSLATGDDLRPLAWILAAGLGGHVALVAAEIVTPHANRDVAIGAHDL